MSLREIIEAKCKTTGRLPWPPTAQDLKCSTTWAVQSQGLDNRHDYRISKWWLTCHVCVEDNQKIVSTCQGIMNLAMRERRLMPKHSSLAMAVRHITASAQLIGILNGLGQLGRAANEERWYIHPNKHYSSSSSNSCLGQQRLWGRNTIWKRNDTQHKRHHNPEAHYRWCAYHREAIPAENTEKVSSTTSCQHWHLHKRKKSVQNLLDQKWNWEKTNTSTHKTQHEDRIVHTFLPRLKKSKAVFYNDGLATTHYYTEVQFHRSLTLVTCPSLMPVQQILTQYTLSSLIPKNRWQTGAAGNRVGQGSGHIRKSTRNLRTKWIG